MIELKRKGTNLHGDDYFLHEESGRYFVNIDGTDNPEVLYGCMPQDDPDGEPGWPITDFKILNPPTDMEKREKQFRGEYLLLSRLQMDCKYFLGSGNRNEKTLWAGNVSEQIAKMKELWNIFPEDLKPEWCTWEQILDYEKRMS